MVVQYIKNEMKSGGNSLGSIVICDAGFKYPTQFLIFPFPSFLTLTSSLTLQA